MANVYDVNGNPIITGQKDLDDLLPDRLLIWHDEFDSPVLDPLKWNNIYGNYRNFCWNSKDIMRNISSGDGMSYWAAKDYPNSVSNFSGAYIHTNNLFEFRYGRIEAKMRFPDVLRHHTTFWTLGACGEFVSTSETTTYEDKGVYFPSCGEIDMAEFESGDVGARTHWAQGGFDTQSTARQGGNINSMTGTPTQWHIYSCEWTETAITFYLDGVQKSTFSVADATVNGWNPFLIPHYLIFNCVSSITDRGNITWDEAKTDVAWVRVYAPVGVTNYIEETAISIPSEISISVSERSYLAPTFTPENPSDMTIKWESGNTGICTVYGGMVTGVSAGTTIVTAKTKHGLVAYCKVTVA